MKIELKNGECFEYENLHEEAVQKMLHNAYDKDNENRAKCLCNEKAPPELVISYMRPPARKFYISRMPGQNPLLHSKGCFFREHKPTGKYTGKNGLTLEVPIAGGRTITDHVHAKQVLKAIWSELEENYLVESSPVGWRTVKDLVRLVAEKIDLNKKPLLGVTSVVVPKLYKDATIMTLPEGRVVVCELHEATEVKKGSIRILAKGIKNVIWLNNYRVSHLDSSTKRRILLDSEKKNESARYIMLMTVIDGLATNDDLHCSSVSLMTVDKETFVSI